MPRSKLGSVEPYAMVGGAIGSLGMAAVTGYLITQAPSYSTDLANDFVKTVWTTGAVSGWGGFVGMIGGHLVGYTAGITVEGAKYGLRRMGIISEPKRTTRNYFRRGVTAGTYMGMDPLGTVYSMVNIDSDSTIGGIGLRDSVPRKKLAYRAGKFSAFSQSLIVNLMSGGILQGASLAAIPILRSKTGSFMSRTKARLQEEYKKSV